MTDKVTQRQSISKIISDIDDQITGGGWGGFFRQFGQRETDNLPIYGISPLLDGMAKNIREQNLSVEATAVGKLLHTVEHVSRVNFRDSNSEGIASSALKVMSAALQKPIPRLDYQDTIDRLNHLSYQHLWLGHLKFTAIIDETQQVAERHTPGQRKLDGFRAAISASAPTTSG